MNKAQLIEKLSTQLGSKKAATDAVEAVVDTITRSVAAGERVAITGFGVFEKVARPARLGRNPRTGAAVKIKKTSVPKFKPGQGFKEVVSGARKMPKAIVTVAKTAAATTRTPAAKKATAKKATAKKATATKATARKATATKAPAKKVTATKSATKKSTAAKTLATKAPTKKAATKSTAARTLASKAPAKKSPAKKATTRAR